MKKIFYTLIILVIVSCEKETSEGIPSYIKINNITVIDTTDNYSATDTSRTKNISDVWVSINGVNQGIYELPANFPVLNNGNVEVRIYAGIKDNGISAQRVSYPFYYSHLENTKLTPDSTTIINPIVGIKENIDGQFDDFDESFSFNYDSCCFEKIDANINGPYQNYGSLILKDSIFTTEIKYKDQTQSFDDLPQAGSPTYFELDYRNNTRFLVGAYINYSNGPTIEKSLLWVSPKDNWNKIYINLTETVAESIAAGAKDFSVFIKMERDFTLEKNELIFDNIRIIHYTN